jgi:hypothetical protein
MFGPKDEEVTRHRREVQNEVLHDVHSFPNIIWVIKSRRISWVGQVREKPKCVHCLGWKGLKEDHLIDVGVDDRTVLNNDI